MLLTILGGLDAPTSGAARFRDQERTGALEDELTAYWREHVSFVFQFYNLIPSLNVAENVRLVADIATDPMPVEEAIALVGLTPRLHHCPSELSGGEQQRARQRDRAARARRDQEGQPRTGHDQGGHHP